jgi:hypothetical protein
MVRYKQTARKSKGLFPPSVYKHKPPSSVYKYKPPSRLGLEHEPEIDIPLPPPRGRRRIGTTYTGTKSSSEDTGFLAGATHLAASENRPSPIQRIGRKLGLPVVIRGHLIVAIPDTGSDIDAMEIGLIEELGLMWRRLPRRSKKVRLSDGSVLHAIGKVTARCYFDREEQTYFQRTFFVLPKISSQAALIFGGRFLAQTETLTKHQHRLEELPSVAKAVPQVMNMCVSKSRLACYIDSVLTLAIADTGSEVNLINEDYAIERDYAIEAVAEEEEYVVLPGDRVATITGKIKVKFDTLHASPITQGSSETSSTTCTAQSAVPETRSVASSVDSKGSHDPITFYVMPALTIGNIVLSKQLLDSIDAFNTHRNSFVNFKRIGCGVDDLAFVRWLHLLDRKLRAKSDKIVTWPPASVRSEFKKSVNALLYHD